MTQGGLPRVVEGGRLHLHPQAPMGAPLEPVQGTLIGAHVHPHWGPHELSTSARMKGTPLAQTTHADTCPLTGHTEEQTTHGVTYLRRTPRKAHGERCGGADPQTMCTERTRTHHGPHGHVHARCHSVPGKDKDTVSPHPHITTHKHADRRTHTGGCCVAPTSTCGVFSSCLFWGRKTDRFSSPPPLGPASPSATSRSPGRGTESPRCLLPSVHTQPSTLQGIGLGALLCANTRTKYTEANLQAHTGFINS